MCDGSGDARGITSSTRGGSGNTSSAWNKVSQLLLGDSGEDGGGVGGGQGQTMSQMSTDAIYHQSLTAAVQQQQSAEPPLKILVPNEYVGAVIGRGGGTIRAISKATGARLDIFRNCGRYDVPEKPVTIYGPPEKASNACRKILEIMIHEFNYFMEEQEKQQQQEQDQSSGVVVDGQEQQPANPQQRKNEVTLRMFAQDSFIGRVIGKKGSVIKKIMEDTQTKIHISTQNGYGGKDASTNPGNRHYLPPTQERLITIRGSIDGMCTAEAIISEKLREAYQNESSRVIQSRAWNSGNGGGSHHHGGNLSYSAAVRGGYGGGGGSSDDEYVQQQHHSSVSNNGGGVPPRRKFNSRTPFTLSTKVNNVNHPHHISQYIPGGTYATYPSSTGGGLGGNGSGGSSYLSSLGYSWSNTVGGGSSTTDYQPQHYHQHQQAAHLSRPESVNIYVPDDVVGALIGRKGSNIRQIIQQTGASVKIMEETLIINDSHVRRVVINGVIDSLFKAQYLIYDKCVEEGKGPTSDQYIDDIRLTVEMSVPTEMVGRLIGKAGQNIRDIQKMFVCRVKFMTDPDETLPPAHDGETYVRINGNYGAFLGAQRKIREMLIKAMTRSFRGFGAGPVGQRVKNENEQQREDPSDMMEQSPAESGNITGNSEEDRDSSITLIPANSGTEAIPTIEDMASNIAIST